MSMEVYGDPSQVRELSKKLLAQLSEIKELNKQGKNLLKRMQGSVKDSAYQEMETMTDEIAQSMIAGLEDAAKVMEQLKKYADYLDSL